MARQVRNCPPSSLSTIPSESSWPSSWRDAIGGEEVPFEELVNDDDDDSDDYEYESSFEEYISEEEEEADAESQPVEWTTIDLQNGVKLLVPDNVSEFRCKAIPLWAEKRTDMLSQFPHYHDETMVSDVYELEGEDIQSLNCKPKYLQIPLVLPTTRLDVHVLFRFHVMVCGDGGWTPVPAQYEDCLLKFPIQGGKYFVAYARPIPEFRRISRNAFTFVSDKDKRIKVHIQEGAVDTEMTISVKVQPVDTNRLEWYRLYDPSAFEGIYALSDILSVRHKMEKVFNIDTTVELPIADLSEEEYELKSISIENNHYVVRDLKKESSLKDVAIMPHTVNNATSCQMACVRRGLPTAALIQAALFQAGRMDKCTILMFLSKDNKDRWLTVEVVGSNSADQVAESRQQRNFFEISRSRSGSFWIKLSDRIRVHLAGNMRSAEQVKKTKYSFQYIHQSRNNFIQFRTQKVVSGSAYSVVEVSIAGQQVHEVHFNYPDAGYNLKYMKNLRTYRPATREETQYYPTPVAHEPPSEVELPSCGASDTGYNTEESGRQENTRSEATTPMTVSASSDESGMGSGISEMSEGASSSSRSRLSRSVSMPASASHNRPTSSNFLGSTWPEGTVASSSPSEHPVLTQESLLVLGRHVTLRDCQDALISLGMNFDTICKIKQEAKDQDANDVFLLLLRWYQNMRTTMDTVLLIKKLEGAFKKVGRSDLSNTLAKVRKKRRGLKNKDFA
ncbi:uncharacterized protein LOC124264372 [Haliotis rubra]|uniref:uncharacterized protein LOC124264372 n=1 Tax=Haliotis rubra TaxID=36100 RepID=UPI001EE5019D|nr:uncharacterized protein LOC124264372 [Haliotis rubra]